MTKAEGPEPPPYGNEGFADLINAGYNLLAAGDPDGAALRFRDALRLRPNSPLAHQNLGSALRSMHRWTDAEGELSEAIRLGGGGAKVLFGLGECQRRQGRFAEALACFERSTQLDPTLGVSFYRMGIVLLVMRRFDDAQCALEKAVSLNPRDVLARCNLGVALRHRGEKEREREQYRAAIGIDEYSFPARLALAQWWERAGAWEEAAAEFRRALALAPEDVAVHMGLARALLFLGRDDAAAHVYQQALRLEPGNWYVRFQLGNLKLDQGEAKLAEDYYRQAIVLSPNSGLVRSCVGRARMFERDMVGAETEFRLSVAAQPGSADAHCGLADLLSALGRYEEAETEYEICLRLNPTHELARVNYPLALIFGKGSLEGSDADLDRGTAMLLQEAFSERRDAWSGTGLGLALLVGGIRKREPSSCWAAFKCFEGAKLDKSAGIRVKAALPLLAIIARLWGLFLGMFGK